MERHLSTLYIVPKWQIFYDNFFSFKETKSISKCLAKECGEFLYKGKKILESENYPADNDIHNVTHFNWDRYFKSIDVKLKKGISIRVLGSTTVNEIIKLIRDTNPQTLNY